MLGGLTSWRAAFDELGIQPAIFAFVGGRPTSNRKIIAAWSDVFVPVSPSCVTSHWMRRVMDYAPSVTHWCLGRRCLEPADAQDASHLRNFILQHTPSVAVSFLVTAPVDFSREAVKANLQHLKTWPKLACPSVLSDLSVPMLVWLSWNVIEAEDQTGEPESFPRVTMVSISGAHHRHLRPGWALADGAGAMLPNFPLVFATRVYWEDCKLAARRAGALPGWPSAVPFKTISLSEWAHLGQCLALHATFRKEKCHGLSRRLHIFSLAHQRCYTTCARVRALST